MSPPPHSPLLIPNLSQPPPNPSPCPQYRAGLDVRGDTYGTHSVYTTWREFEVMFHVSTFLPYRANDYQQLQRKRHIGNDICVIIFMDGETPYAPGTPGGCCSVKKKRYVCWFLQPHQGAR